ncbi:nitrite reductase small subunit NirD [Halomonas sp. MCCC 1A17488]|uniref:nitrite reductase small subunit NirD n=1 Tax=unclassified Halomonas TaxID=2609666 RepID=UPI0018D265F2|nr:MULTISPECIES: nitrite reductase small subunit NirD [unclassified Halomonas]MCE8016115.1 nitrite reductase small subunit NirD [Halomonas sp. MCCC 1A17488]MCG3239448.1 nitrite reductase small subunit NirD [Halomonas sp. MCCC 1A17488]QPP50626.1 nitrite reductase small subunit NirD [Halomonas sp. SS10-MC5]
MSSAIAAKTMTQTWQRLCTRADLVPYSGVAAWVETPEGPAQVAIFYIPSDPNKSQLPGQAQELYAIDHHDPFSSANVIARGIVGDLKGQLVVASPIYKQHFRLEDGQCLEDDSVRLRTWKVSFKGDEVWIEA